jgi:hypothetical protein
VRLPLRIIIVVGKVLVEVGRGGPSVLLWFTGEHGQEGSPNAEAFYVGPTRNAGGIGVIMAGMKRSVMPRSLPQNPGPHCELPAALSRSASDKPPALPEVADFPALERPEPEAFSSHNNHGDDAANGSRRKPARRKSGRHDDALSADVSAWPRAHCRWGNRSFPFSGRE